MEGGRILIVDDDSAMRRALADDTRQLLVKIKKRTKIIWGAQDKIVSVSDAYEMHRRIAGSELKVMARGRHGLHHPPTRAQFAREVTGFIC